MYKNLSPGAIGISATMREALRLATLGKFEGMSLPLAEAAALAGEKGVPYVKALYDSFSLRVGEWGLPVAWNGPEEVFNKDIEQLRVYGALAAKLGAFRTATWIPSWSDDKPFEENFGYHVERLGKVAAVLKESGCRFGLEFLGPRTLRDGHRHEFIHTLDGMLELCRAIGTGNVGLLFDSFHWYTSGGTTADFAKLRREDVVVVHINDARPGPRDEQPDSPRALPGETGVIDLAGFLAGLRGIGYDGPVTPEPFSEKLKGLPPEIAVALTGGRLERVWNGLGVGGEPETKGHLGI